MTEFWLFFWPLLAVMASVFFVAFAPRISRSRLCMRVFQNDAYKEVKCRWCTAGAQYLNPVTMERGPIPDSLHMVHDDRPWEIGPRQANILSCSECGGRGSYTTRDRTVANAGLKETL